MYDYTPTPMGIHRTVEEAFTQENELLRPEKSELMQLQTKEKLPRDEKQLHSLLMTEGDLAAGEMEIPIEWQESLSAQGRVVYLEQGLWIAAEQRQEYENALWADDREAMAPVIRRMLRYRGGASLCQIARRYGLSMADTQAVLESLCEKGEVTRL